MKLMWWTAAATFAVLNAGLVAYVAVSRRVHDHD